MKLVRDLIPTIIEESGSSCAYHTVEGEELKQRLYEKMREELDEFIEDPCVEEAADILEVLFAMAESIDVTPEDILEVATSKFRERGGFKCGIVLEEVIDESR